MTTVNRRGNTFAAQVGEWTVAMKDRTKRVWQESTLRLVEVMQTPVFAGGRMPVDTGFLRASLMCSTSPISSLVDRPARGVFVYDPGEIAAVIRSAKVGETIYLAYTASYANAQEYGTAHIPAKGFQRGAVQQWPAIVAQTEASLLA